MAILVTLFQTYGLCPADQLVGENESLAHTRQRRKSHDTDSSLLLAGAFPCLNNMACVELCKITAQNCKYETLTLVLTR